MIRNDLLYFGSIFLPIFLDLASLPREERNRNMKIKYAFATETVEIEVEDTWATVLIDMDRQE